MFDFETPRGKDPAPVVLLSGAFGGPGEWTGVAGALGEGFDPACFGAPAEGIGAVARAPHGAHLVAHGTAAHAAILAADAAPWLVRSLTLIDPDLAPALPGIAVSPVHRPALEMRARAATYAAEGDAWNAAREAIDFWMGAGAFLASSTALQQRFASRVGRMSRDHADQAARPLDIYTLAGVVCPTLVLTGRDAAAELREIQRLLVHAIPFAERGRMPGAGACSHLTDPHLVGPMLRDFLARAERGWHYPTMGMSAAA